MKIKVSFYLILICSAVFCSCANQLPPPGGEDDKTPPQIILISPRPGAVNFRQRTITFRFDEYVDRRSFEESFFISPGPPGEISFDWSGKEVDVEFSKSLEKDRTYVIIVGSDLKDIRGNRISSPFSFAFSTGNKIDKGKISGKVFADSYERVKVLAYQTNGKPADKLDPRKEPSDYVIQVSPDGSFEFSNLPEGTFRLFAITDEDRNNLYGKEFERITGLSQDYILTSDSLEIKGLNFIFKDFELNPGTKEFLKKLKPDSVNYIFSNISEGEKNIIPGYKFYFYFKNNNVPKAGIVNNFSLTRIGSAEPVRVIFNWINDSLVEIFSTETFGYSSDMKIDINLTNTEKKYFYSVRFQTAAKNNFGTVSGKIISGDTIASPVIIRLYNKNNDFISYSQKFSDTTAFVFDNVLEGDYLLISFIDEDDDGKPGTGTYYPFRGAEKFIIYDKDIIVRGGWNVEDIFLEF